MNTKQLHEQLTQPLPRHEKQSDSHLIISRLLRISGVSVDESHTLRGEGQEDVGLILVLLRLM
jgi:hypothetical protein